MKGHELSRTKGWELAKSGKEVEAWLSTLEVRRVEKGTTTNTLDAEPAAAFTTFHFPFILLIGPISYSIYSWKA
jgi:hypothetical protein